MGIFYNKLWKLLIDKKMTSVDLRKAAHIAPNTLTRMKRDQEVTIHVLERICDVLDVDLGDIVEYIPDKENVCESPLGYTDLGVTSDYKHFINSQATSSNI